MGEISLLLDSPSLATVRTLKPSRLFRLGKNEFWQMLSSCPSVASQVFRTMATRVRNMEGYSQQREKLASLGTMAAGLAHELNNPATAARRAAAHLREVVDNLQSFACELHESFQPEQWPHLIDSPRRSGTIGKSAPLDSVTRSDREEGWHLAGATRCGRWMETFIRICRRRFGDEELAALAKTIPRGALRPRWGGWKRACR